MRGAVNNRIFDALSWRKAHSALRHPRFHHGFNDYMADLPFDYRTLDGWTLLEQHRYENGREVAAECRVAGLTLRWADRTRIPWELKALVVGRIRSRRSGPHPGKQREPGSRRLEGRRPTSQKPSGTSLGGKSEALDQCVGLPPFGANLIR